MLTKICLQEHTSRYWKISENIFSSEILKWTSLSGWEKSWMMPFMSRYKLSNSGIYLISNAFNMSRKKVILKKEIFNWLDILLQFPLDRDTVLLSKRKTQPHPSHKSRVCCWKIRECGLFIGKTCREEQTNVPKMPTAPY